MSIPPSFVYFLCIKFASLACHCYVHRLYFLPRYGLVIAATGPSPECVVHLAIVVSAVHAHIQWALVRLCLLLHVSRLTRPAMAKSSL